MAKIDKRTKEEWELLDRSTTTVVGKESKRVIANCAATQSNMTDEETI